MGGERRAAAVGAADIGIGGAHSGVPRLRGALPAVHGEFKAGG